MKYCSKCKTTKELSEFTKNAKYKDGLHVQCKSCYFAYQKRWYLKNKEVQSIRTKRNRDIIWKENTQNVAQYLLLHPCVDCGESDIRVLDFDHLQDKKMGIARMMRLKHWYDIVEEIKKCEVVCSGCHRIRTCVRSNNWRQRFWESTL